MIRSKAAENCRTPKRGRHSDAITSLAFWSAVVPHRFSIQQIDLGEPAHFDRAFSAKLRQFYYGFGREGRGFGEEGAGWGVTAGVFVAGEDLGAAGIAVADVGDGDAFFSAMREARSLSSWSIVALGTRNGQI